MSTMEERELQRLNEILRHIVATLNTVDVLADEEQDIYLAERLNLITQSKKLWFWRLILEPMDSDFLNLAYRAILRREPDPQAWNHFHARLSAGTTFRIDVLKVIVDSAEFKEVRPDGIEDGGGSLFLLHKISLGLRKAQMLGSVVHLIWIMATNYQRKKRHESIMNKIQVQISELKEFEMCMAEYLNNHKRKFNDQV